MVRQTAIAVVLLATCAALPAWAGDREDCDNGESLARTDAPRVVAACRRLAEQGDAAAASHLGWFYDGGKGVPQDYAEAEKWYLKAADQGYAKAEFNLGVLHEFGRGAPVDYVAAVRWYRKAADQGLANAQYNLGILYADGHGVAQDYVQAYMWLSLSAAQGKTQAAQKRDIAGTRMTAEQIDKAKALAAAWKPTTGQ